METTLDLPSLLALERRDARTWVGVTDAVRLPRLFGGQLVAQSIVAAGSSVPPDREVHSIHTTFLRSGLSGVPVSYVVEDLRDGRLSSVREVRAWQGDRLVCRSTISATGASDGISHTRPAVPSPGPGASRDLHEVAAADGGLGTFWEGFAAVEVRIDPVDPDRGAAHSASTPHQVWMRSASPLGDDPLLHRAALGYASDLMLMSTALAPHGHTAGHERSLIRRWNGVSLDHCLWFHRPLRADDWFLVEHATPSAFGGRALVTADIFDAAGRVACHVTQEALIRPARPAATSDAHPPTRPGATP